MRDQEDQGTIRTQVLELIKQKDKIEDEIRELMAILTQVGCNYSLFIIAYFLNVF